MDDLTNKMNVGGVIDEPSEMLLECLPISTAFNFVYARESYPSITSTCHSCVPEHTQCISCETGTEHYRHNSMIVQPILKFSFERRGNHLLWTHGKAANVVSSLDIDADGKLKSFVIGIGKAVSVEVPAFAECTFYDN